TQLFTVLAVTLAIWSVQGIYARAFYAASDTKTPAITGTVVTVLSIPMYAALFHADGLRGLAFASDIGIFVQTAALAFLLHKKRLVSLAHLEGSEMLRALAAALLSFAVAFSVVHRFPQTTTHTGDILVIAAGSIVWGAAAFATLLATRSQLPQQLLRRLKP
ncbi:MAG: lipid II flippase MurJ, partial [Bryocella sp.]